MMEDRIDPSNPAIRPAVHSRIVRLAFVLGLLTACVLTAVPVQAFREWGPGQGSRVSPAFHDEIARIAADGLHLEESVESALDGRNLYMAALFKRARPKTPSEAYEFRILQSHGQSSKTVFRRSEFFFSFRQSGDLGTLNATDINGDSLKEIIVMSSSGGNCWSCNPTEIYRVNDGKVDLIAAGPIQRIVDLNRDGLVELVLADTRWEVYGELSHAASPFAAVVYAWRDGRYIYASREYPAFYRSEIERLSTALAEARFQITADEFSDDSYIGYAISLAITHAHMGDPDRGVKELQDMMDVNVRSPDQSGRRKAVVNDFVRGESATRLREMKHGDPMPLG